MKRGRSTGKPTVAQARRFMAIQEIGCIACRIDGFQCADDADGVLCEIHHLTVGGKHGQKRRGHDFTIGLCQWHHRGVPYGLCLGPAYSMEPREFRRHYGDDETLLALQNGLIAGNQVAA